MDYNNSITTAEDLNQYFIKTSLWPAITYTTFLMIVGTLGNVLVLIVYRRHYRRSVTRMFIFALAALDLGNCLVTMPSELVVLIEFTTFPSAALCKASRFLTYTFNSTSSIILICIALDRYFKVCRPTKIYITIGRARKICLGGFVFAAVTAAPALVIYGDMMVSVMVNSTGVHMLPFDMEYSNISIDQPTFSSVPTYNLAFANSDVIESSISGASPSIIINANFCLLNSHYIHSAWPMLFYASLFFMYLVMVVMVIFFYSTVARAIFFLKSKHSEKFAQFDTNKNSLSGSDEQKKSRSSGFHNDLSSNIFINDPGNVGMPRSQSCPSNSQSNKKVNIHSKVKNTIPGIDLDKSDEAISFASKVDPMNETGYETNESGSQRDLFNKNKNHKNNASRDPLNCDINVASTRNKNENNKPRKHIARNQGDIFDTQYYKNPVMQMLSLRDEETLSPRTSVVEQSKKKQRSKLPKIKVQCESLGTTEDLHRQQTSHCGQLYGQDLVHDPVFYNSLLLRRIKSADNVRMSTGLSKLRVPGEQSNNRSFCAKRTCSHRKNAVGIGKMSKSCVSLDIDVLEDDQFDYANAADKILTLTKTSPKGKKKLCVLPVTGLATKAAIQTIELQNMNVANHSEKPSSERNPHTGSEGQNRVSCPDSSQPSVCVEGTNVVGILKETTTEKDVTLRHVPLKESNQIRELGDKLTSPRQKIVSTVDILRERHQQNSLHPVRTSRMLFLISLVFVISFLPFFIVVVMRSSFGPSFLASLNAVELAFLSVIIRSSLISNAVNPIIYGFLSTHFRRECADIMCCIWDE